MKMMGKVQDGNGLGIVAAAEPFGSGREEADE